MRSKVISLTTFIIVFAAIFLISMLVHQNLINVEEGVLIALPFSILAVYLSLKFGRPEKVKHIRARILL